MFHQAHVQAAGSRYLEISNRFYYVLYWPDAEALNTAGVADFEAFHAIHWGIECFHRAGKQLCALRRFRVRLKEAIHTHLFCAMRAFVELELQAWQQQLGN